MATINLTATAAIELADVLDYVSKWIGDEDPDTFAGCGYDIIELQAVLTNLANQLLSASDHP